MKAAHRTSGLIILALLALPIMTGAQAGPLPRGAPMTAPAIKPSLDVAQSAGPTLKLARAADSGRINPRDILRGENFAADSALRANLRALQKPLCEACITAINGKAPAKVTYTPGANGVAARYVIAGAGFGSAAGKVYLAGPFKRRPELRVDTWNDRQIVAYFPEGFGGEYDQTGVSLVAMLPSGQQIASAGDARFVASRYEVKIGLDRIPDSAMTVDQPKSGSMTRSYGGLFYSRQFTGTVIADNGDLSAWKRGYKDRIDFDFLPKGFEAVAFSLRFCEYKVGPSDGGGAYVYGENRATWVGDAISIDRATWHRHVSRLLANPPMDSFVTCFQDLDVTLTGPVGISLQ